MSVILGKYVRKCVIFQPVSKIELFQCTAANMLIKIYYVLSLISVFIVQVVMLVRFA